MAATQMALENWCMCLSLEEINKYLDAMKLKTSGARFKKLSRASRWLLGDYSVDDFIATNADADEHTAWVDRANLRHTFIDRVCSGEIETPWVQGSEEKEPPQLEYLRDDDAVEVKLEQTRLNIETRTVEKSSLEDNETDDNEQETTTGETQANKNADTTPEPAHQNVVTTETTNPAIPVELSTLLTQLTQRVTQLSDNQSILQATLENFTQNAIRTCAEHKTGTNPEQTLSGGVPGYPDIQVSGTAAQKPAHTTDITTTAQTSPTHTPHNRLVGEAWEGGSLPNQTNSGGLCGNANAPDASNPRQPVPN